MTEATSTKKQKIVLAFGTFDVFHEGHQYFLEQAKQYGDQLVVVVARDANVERIKGARPHDTENTRLQNVQAFLAVDKAILGYEDWRQHQQVLADIQPDVICLGYDQKAKIPEGTWRIYRISAFHPEKYKSSLIKQRDLSK